MFFQMGTCLDFVKILNFFFRKIFRILGVYIYSRMNRRNDNTNSEHPDRDALLNGLSRGHVRQIIRRNMISKVKPSGKIYNRSKENQKKYI